LFSLARRLPLFPNFKHSNHGHLAEFQPLFAIFQSRENTLSPCINPLATIAPLFFYFNHSSRHAFQASAEDSVLAHFQNPAGIFFFLFVSFVKLLGGSEF
jgi:hypothetical protein